jgi:hypothetical protein
VRAAENAGTPFPYVGYFCWPADQATSAAPENRL